MKSLISVTPREFKYNFYEVMDACTNMCLTANQEIIITVPEKKNGQIHYEIAKVIPIGKSGHKYEYNYELLKKFGINADNIESIIADAFIEASGIAECAVHNKKAVNKLHNAMTAAAKEFIKTLGL